MTVFNNQLTKFLQIYQPAVGEPVGAALHAPLSGTTQKHLFSNKWAHRVLET